MNKTAWRRKSQKTVLIPEMLHYPFKPGDTLHNYYSDLTFGIITANILCVLRLSCSVWLNYRCSKSSVTTSHAMHSECFISSTLHGRVIMWRGQRWTCMQTLRRHLNTERVQINPAEFTDFISSVHSQNKALFHPRGLIFVIRTIHLLRVNVKVFALLRLCWYFLKSAVFILSAESTTRHWRTLFFLHSLCLRSGYNF